LPEFAEGGSLTVYCRPSEFLNIEYIILNTEYCVLMDFMMHATEQPHCIKTLVTAMFFVHCVDVVILGTLTLLIWWQEEHPAHKKLSDAVLVWLSVWSKVHMIYIWSA